MPYILILDLDENLIFLKDQCSDGRLRESALPYLSRSNDGIVSKPTLFGISRWEPDKLVALSRHQWNGIFERIESINKSKEIMSIKVLTSSGYDKTLILPILSKLFNYDFSQCEYINYKDMQRISGNYATLSINKGYVIDKKFLIWSKQYPGLTKKSVLLVDDNAGHVQITREKGYSAFHNQTSNNARDDNGNYYYACKDSSDYSDQNLFTELNDWLNEIEGDKLTTGISKTSLE